jgi:hypothetical protein
VLKRFLSAPVLRSIFLAPAMATLLSLVVQPAAAGTQWSDNFESYTLGTFPSSGGWELPWNGSGDAAQVVGTAPADKGGKALTLTGSYCWSSFAFHAVDFGVDSVITCEASVLIQNVSTPGCGGGPASFGLMNPYLGTWGTYYASVVFDYDGYFRGGNQPVPYQTNVWYDIALVTNYSTRLMDVYLDGAKVGTNIALPATGMPTGLYVSAGHGAAPVIWYDDITATTGLSQTPVRATSWGALKSSYR